MRLKDSVSVPSELLTLLLMLLFILHPASWIVAAEDAVMLSPVPVAISVESNIFAPVPTRRALLFEPVQTKRHLRIVPVNVPLYAPVFVNKQSSNDPVAVAALGLPNPVPPVTVQRVNDPEAECPAPFPNPLVQTQSVNVPDAFPLKEDVPAVHLINVPNAAV